MFLFRQKVRNNFEILKKAAEVGENRKNVHVGDENRTKMIKSVAIVRMNIMEVIFITLCLCTTPKMILFHCFESLEKYLMFLILF